MRLYRRLAGVLAMLALLASGATAAEVCNTAVFSQTDANNNTGTMPSWLGSAAPSTIDDAGRAIQGAITREWNWRGFTLTAGGTADAKTLTYSVAPAAYCTGQIYSFIANTTNTGSATINVNSLGAKTIKKDVGGVMTALASGDMASGRYVMLTYNGTDMIWVNGSTGYSAGGTDVALADGGTGASLVDPNADRIFFWDDSAGATDFLTLGTAYATSTTTLRSPTESFCVAASDETTNLTTGTAKITFRMPYAFTVSDVRGSLSTVATGATLLTVDVNEAGTTIISTKLTFDASESTTTTAATPRVISDTSLADDAQMTVDIDAIGNTTPGRGLKVCLIGYQT